VGPQEIVEVARQAEDAGWAGVWMIEYEYDSFAFAQAIATATSRIVTGSCIARVYPRHPLLVAETATVIDRLAPGRFVIGLGHGGVSEPGRGSSGVDRLTLQRWGVPSERAVARMREYVEVIRRALSGASVDYDGEFYRFEGVKLSITPSGDVPIYLGARKPGMLRLAGEVADGVFLWLTGEHTTRSSIEAVRDAAAAAGRDAAGVKVGCLIPTCVGEDGSAARGAMRTYLVDFYLGRAAYAEVLADGGFEEVGANVKAHVARGDAAGAATCITDDALDDLTIAGNPQDCRAHLARWAARGIELPVLYVFPPDGDWGAAYGGAIRALAPGSG
jgi:alkanesulfonate monooxygenase SsuD/methylene tetrahydromethanopterin reductase-like flavin-dependent oxidoreductase (luciferase family)